MYLKKVFASCLCVHVFSSYVVVCSFKLWPLHVFQYVTAMWMADALQSGLFGLNISTLSCIRITAIQCCSFNRTTLKSWVTYSACCPLSSPVPPGFLLSVEQWVTNSTQVFCWQNCVFCFVFLLQMDVKWREWCLLSVFSAEDRCWPGPSCGRGCCAHWLVASMLPLYSSTTLTLGFF